MPEPICPACGEGESLTGRPVDDDIAITCGRCGAEWMRGEPRCKRCGRAGGMSAPQQMTRHPRGTLLAVVGVRQTLLCGTCDSDVIAAAVERRKPVPDGYVSRFLFGEPHQADPEPEPPQRTSPRATEPAGSRSVGRPTPQPRKVPPQRTDPTFRQATEAFLDDDGTDADSLTMVLLGGKPGPSTRLSRLDTDTAAEDLQQWVDRTFAPRPDQRDAAVDTLRRAVRHWRGRGWLSRDLTADL